MELQDSGQEQPTLPCDGHTHIASCLQASYHASLLHVCGPGRQQQQMPRQVTLEQHLCERRHVAEVAVDLELERVL